MANEPTMLHRWLKVIVPVGAGMVPCMCAYCPNCNQYFTEPIRYSQAGGKLLTPSGLPSWGCNPPPDVPAIPQDFIE